jgi:hypothetical protein
VRNLFGLNKADVGDRVSKLLMRFVIGGLLVSAFAVVGDLFKPKSFGGLFGAAPSVALATLALTIAKNGRSYAAIEARSMLAGAAALFAYAIVVSRLLMRHISAFTATVASVPVWFTTAFLCWMAFLK